MNYPAINPSEVVEFCSKLPEALPVLMLSEIAIGVITILKEDARLRGIACNDIRANRIDYSDLEQIKNQQFWQKPGIVIIDELQDASPQTLRFIEHLLIDREGDFDPAKSPRLFLNWTIDEPLFLSAQIQNRLKIIEVRRPQSWLA